MTSRRWKTLGILSPLLAASVALVSWTQEWTQITLNDGLIIAVNGDVAAPALPALALASLALVGALALAGLVFRVLLGLLQTLLGLAMIVSVVPAMADPVAASASAVTEATGLSGRETLRELVDMAILSAWPWLALGAGLVAILAGLLIAVSTARWPQRSRRYDAVRLSSTEHADVLPRNADAPEADRAAAWDALSDGDDPTTR